MKRLKLMLSILIFVGVFFSVVAPVQADTPPPEKARAEGPDLSFSTLVDDDYVPSDDLLSPDVTTPYPVSPSGSNYTFNLTPKLYFSKNSSATAYKIYMYDFKTTLTLLYTYVGGTENCGSGYCWLQPPTKLKVYKYDQTMGGYYAWKVEAMIGNSWVPNETYGTFYVMSSGFTSTFTYDSKGWKVLNGEWTLTSKGYYKTLGIPMSIANTWRKELFLNNMVIEARVKRKVETGSSTRILFFGYPNLLGNGYWSNAYTFYYYDDGVWELSKYISGVKTTLATAGTTYAEINGWNTFKIWVHDHYISLWINDIYITTVYDSARSYGAVGLAMYEGNPDISPLLVDYVKVYYSAVAPYEIPEESGVPLAPAVEPLNREDMIIK